MSSNAPDSKTVNGPTSATTGGQTAPSEVVLPIGDSPPSPGAVAVAQALADEGEGGILLVKVVAVPEQTPLVLAERDLTPHRETLQESLTLVAETNPETPVTGLIRIGHRRARIIADTANAYAVSTVVFDHMEHGKSIIPVRRSVVERVRDSTSCRLVILNNSRRPRDISSLLVPIAGGPHSEQAVAIARALAHCYDAWIDLVHIVDPDPTPTQYKRAQQYFETGSAHLEAVENWDTWLLEADSVADAIIEQSTYYDGTVLGYPRKHRLKRFVFGSIPAAVKANAANMVLTVCD